MATLAESRQRTGPALQTLQTATLGLVDALLPLAEVIRRDNFPNAEAVAETLHNTARHFNHAAQTLYAAVTMLPQDAWPEPDTSSFTGGGD